MFIIADRVHLSACVDCRDRSPVSVRQRCDAISTNVSLVVVGGQANLVHVVREQLVMVGSNAVHGDLLHAHLAQAPLVVAKVQLAVFDALLHTLRCVLTLDHTAVVNVLERVEFRSQANELRHARAVQFILELANHLAVRLVVEWVIKRVLAEVKPVLEGGHLGVHVRVFDSYAE